ncbi:hypothetical protein CW304_13600 [Bacillus sp. UFRGS-B20]|nr:hypothetical protein CW304_13600 [Bacillus sp. UFRGS-B20]
MASGFALVFEIGELIFVMFHDFRTFLKKWSCSNGSGFVNLPCDSFCSDKVGHKISRLFVRRGASKISRSPLSVTNALRRHRLISPLGFHLCSSRRLLKKYFRRLRRPS